MTIITPDDRATPARGPVVTGAPVPHAPLDAVGSRQAVDLDAVGDKVQNARPDVPAEVIRAAVAQAAWGFRDATIPTYLPVLIERRVRLHLRLEWPLPAVRAPR